MRSKQMTQISGVGMLMAFNEDEVLGNEDKMGIEAISLRGFEEWREEEADIEV